MAAARLRHHGLVDPIGAGLRVIEFRSHRIHFCCLHADERRTVEQGSWHLDRNARHSACRQTRWPVLDRTDQWYSMNLRHRSRRHENAAVLRHCHGMIATGEREGLRAWKVRNGSKRPSRSGTPHLAPASRGGPLFRVRRLSGRAPWHSRARFQTRRRWSKISVALVTPLSLRPPATRRCRSGITAHMMLARFDHDRSRREADLVSIKLRGKWRL
jgi:hypothetical protein